MTLPLGDIEVTGIKEHPATDSVKLHGPPGTGKTTQCAARVALLLENHGYDIGDIAWVTYRRSLAEDVLQRLVDWGVISRNQLDNPSQGPTRNISTIHAVANRSVGALPDVAEWWQKRNFCDDRGIDFYAENSWETSQGKLMFRVFDWLCNNCYDPGNQQHIAHCPFYEDLQDKWPGVDVTELWNLWELYKNQEDIIDFHEMLSAPLEEQVSPTDGVLVVDEYHDATPLMAQVCEYWMLQADTVIVAGDPEQVVNSFEGASPKFFERIAYPEILLDKTYRVGEEHWKAAAHLLGGSSHDVPPVERRAGSARLVEYNSPLFTRDNDCWTVPDAATPNGPAHIINRRENEDSGTLADDSTTLYLARTKLQVDGICKALEKAGIIYSAQRTMDGWGGGGSNEIKARNRLYDALTALRGCRQADVTDGARGHPQQTVDSYQNDDRQAEERAQDIEIYPTTVETLLEYVDATHLAQSRSDTDDICTDLYFRHRNRNTTAVTLSEIDEWVKPTFWNVYTNGEGSVSSLNKGDLGTRHRRALTQALKNNRQQIGDIPTTVMTIHAAKGYEADTVVLYDGITNKIRDGIAQSVDTKDNEYRTWYVALTRAKNELYIMRDGFDWTRSFLPSNLFSAATQ